MFILVKRRDEKEYHVVDYVFYSGSYLVMCGGCLPHNEIKSKISVDDIAENIICTKCLETCSWVFTTGEKEPIVKDTKIRTGKKLLLYAYEYNPRKNNVQQQNYFNRNWRKLNRIKVNINER